MDIEPTYVPRFVPRALVPALLDAWRMTAVGWTEKYAAPRGMDNFSRAGRMHRAASAFAAAHPQATTQLGAYKDLDGLLGPLPGHINA